MRFLRYSVAALLLANVFAFLWPDHGSAPAHVYPRKVDVQPELIKLNKEVEEAFYQRTQVAQTGEGEAARNCFRLGPFTKLDNFEIAQAALLNAEVDYTKSRREVSRSEVFRLFLGPFAERSQAIAITLFHLPSRADLSLIHNRISMHAVFVGLVTPRFGEIGHMVVKET